MHPRPANQVIFSASSPSAEYTTRPPDLKCTITCAMTTGGPVGIGFMFTTAPARGTGSHHALPTATPMTWVSSGVDERRRTSVTSYAR
eukprot:scaffold317_cov260-Pinguiococcus_pyrenoidosus.AAC.46